MILRLITLLTLLLCWGVGSMATSGSRQMGSMSERRAMAAMRLKSLMRRLLREPDHPWWQLMRESLLNASHLAATADHSMPNTLLDQESLDRLFRYLELREQADLAAGMSRFKKEKNPTNRKRTKQQQSALAIQQVQASLWPTVMIMSLALGLFGFMLLTARVFQAIRFECREEDWSMLRLFSATGLRLILHHFRHEMYGTPLPPRKRFASRLATTLSSSTSSHSSGGRLPSIDGFELLQAPLPLWHRLWRWSFSWVPGKRLSHDLRLLEADVSPAVPLRAGSISAARKRPSLRDHNINDGWHDTTSNSHRRRMPAASTGPSTAKRHSLPHLTVPTPVVMVVPEPTVYPTSAAVVGQWEADISEREQQQQQQQQQEQKYSIEEPVKSALVYPPGPQEVGDLPVVMAEPKELLVTIEEAEEQADVVQVSEEEPTFESQSSSEPVSPSSSSSSTTLSEASRSLDQLLLPSPQPTPPPTPSYAIEHLDTAQDPIHVPISRRSLPPVMNVSPMPGNTQSKLLQRLHGDNHDDLGNSKLARFFTQQGLDRPVPLRSASAQPTMAPAATVAAASPSYDSLYGGIPAGIFGRRAATPIPTPPPSRRPTPTLNPSNGQEMSRRLEEGDLTPPPGLVRRPSSIHHLSAELFDDPSQPRDPRVNDFFEQRRRLHQQQKLTEKGGFGAVGARPRH